MYEFLSYKKTKASNSVLQRDCVKICDRNNIQILEDYFSHKFSRNLSEVYCSQEYQKQSFADVLQNRCT